MPEDEPPSPPAILEGFRVGQTEARQELAPIERGGKGQPLQTRLAEMKVTVRMGGGAFQQLTEGGDIGRAGFPVEPDGLAGGMENRAGCRAKRRLEGLMETVEVAPTPNAANPLCKCCRRASVLA